MKDRICTLFKARLGAKALIWYFYYWVTSFPTPILPSSNGRSIKSMLLLDVEIDMKIYHGMKYKVDISKGFIWDIFWDCITDAKLTKSRVLVNAIHIAIFHGLGCPDLFGILCLDLASAFRHLRDFSTWIGYPNSLPDWVSWILDLLDFSFFFKLSSRLCVSGLFRCELS
jgi:hypothetical protein